MEGSEPHNHHAIHYYEIIMYNYVTLGHMKQILRATILSEALGGVTQGAPHTVL